jgi:3',5'-nucleoside bisphosphate phosphatase
LTLDLEPPLLADLHTHTTASDGTFAPAGLVAAARAAGIALLAVTDHDTLDGVAEAAEAGHRLGVEIVPGVELSVTAPDGQEVHLLALGVDPQHAGLRAHLAAFREARMARAMEMVTHLRALGVPVTDAGVRARAGQGVVARPHVAAEVVAVGGAASIFEAFDRYLGDGRPAAVRKPVFEARTAVRLVHGAGGVAIVAHPGLLPSEAPLDALLRAGADGVEAVHPRHAWATERFLRQEAARLALVVTGGSDFHREDDRARLGRFGVPVATLPPLRRAA